LNPETNSLSPSAKSKGARFNSAIQLINQITNKGNINNRIFSDFAEIKPRSKANLKQQGESIIKISLISYEIF
jgi:hypothetical protein